MDRFTKRAGIFNAAKVGLFLFAGYALLLATSTAAKSEDQAIPLKSGVDQTGKHICITPEFNVAQQYVNCDALAAAYAIALANLQDAAQVADEAYEAWYECELGNEEAVVQSPVISAEHSVLVDD